VVSAASSRDEADDGDRFIVVVLVEFVAPVDLCPLLLFVVFSRFFSSEDMLKICLRNKASGHFAAVKMLMVKRKEQRAW
jgi:hypothetical protein